MVYHPGLSRPRPAKRLRARFFVAPDGTVIEKAPVVQTTLRRQIFNRDQWKCQYCGCPVDWVKSRGWPFRGNAVGHIDHVLPRARGGQNDPANLKLACERCNESKGAH